MDNIPPYTTYKNGDDWGILYDIGFNRINVWPDFTWLRTLWGECSSSSLVDADCSGATVPEKAGCSAESAATYALNTQKEKCPDAVNWVVVCFFVGGRLQRVLLVADSVLDEGFPITAVALWISATVRPALQSGKSCWAQPFEACEAFQWECWNTMSIIV